MEPRPHERQAIDGLVKNGIDRHEAAEVIELTRKCRTLEELRASPGEPDAVIDWDDALEGSTVAVEEQQGIEVKRWSTCYRYSDRWRTVIVDAFECEGTS